MDRRAFLGSAAACAWAADALWIPPGARGQDSAPAAGQRTGEDGIQIEWKDRFLRLSGGPLPAEIPIHYLEAYCRPGSTDRDWRQTVIPHRSQLLSSEDGRIEVLDELDDGVVVHHTIRAGRDEVRFDLHIENSRRTPSDAHWAQPCIRVDGFTGCSRDDARERVPEYARKCFLFIDGEPRMLPTEPWAETARYIPGQVYCPADVPREDVNPRPLSSLVPSCGLCGCYSADGSQIFAVCFEPYQEIFQGVIACIHNDFRIGGVEAGEVKSVRGKIYVVDADLDALRARFRRDFPEQADGA